MISEEIASRLVEHHPELKDDPEAHLSDLIADIMHFCRHNKLDYNEIEEHAARNFSGEVYDETHCAKCTHHVDQHKHDESKKESSCLVKGCDCRNFVAWKD